MAERARDWRKDDGREYPHGRSVLPPGVGARPLACRARQDPQFLLRRAVVEVGLGGVVPPGGVAVRVDVLPVMLNGPAGERVLARQPVLPDE